jgi:hypothetical protein
LRELKEEYGQELLNHLLIVCIAMCNEKEKEELVAVYPPLGSLLQTNKHEPDFMFINLDSKKILCIGLGRKNCFFAIDAASNKSVRVFPSHYGNNDLSYIEDFTKLDHGEFVEEFAISLSQLGEALADFENTPGNIETASVSLDDGPSEDGSYTINGEYDLYTRDEIAGFIHAHEKSLKDCEWAMHLINSLFPDITSGEFNTQDFW